MGRTKCFKREQVIEKATELFWIFGYAKTSLHDLEKATGLNKSSLYSEFKDKDDLFYSCVKHYSETNRSREILSQKPQGLQNIFKFLEQPGSLEKTNGCFIANSVREFAIMPQKTKNLLMSHMQEFSSLVKANLEAANIEKGKIQILSELILTLSVGMALRSNIRNIENRPNLVEAFLDGLLKD